MADSFIIQDVRIFTGTSEITSGHVQVTSGKITSFGAGPPSNVPEGTKVFSKPGHTLLPGFIDAHIHADKGKELALYQALRFGVTTVMDMHNEFPNVAKLKKIAAAEKDMAADFKSSGLSATIDGGWPVPVVTAHDKTPEVSFPSFQKLWSVGEGYFPLLCAVEIWGFCS
jgi:cytosine/adenosine deaminase-related metal-dependent hydrolase